MIGCLELLGKVDCYLEEDTQMAAEQGIDRLHSECRVKTIVSLSEGICAQPRGVMGETLWR